MMEITDVIVEQEMLVVSADLLAGLLVGVFAGSVSTAILFVTGRRPDSDERAVNARIVEILDAVDVHEPTRR